MSGGTFNYTQYEISNIIDTIEDIIEKNGKNISKEDRGIWDSEDSKYSNYPEDIIEEFKNGVKYLKIAQVYAQRIDRLVACDDGEDSFRKRLKEDLKKIK